MDKLVRVIRLDGVPLTRAQFTPEGYLDDRPILTRTGIFEYDDGRGGIRRELRPPEEVFAPASLESYRGRPVILTHDAGLIDKDNVSKHQIGTILTNGYRDGENVRAEIMIHDTDKMKARGLKELSLGYNLDLDETPGEYNGQHYDAIQRNIRINHLALVESARAGEQARLNIDSRDKVSKKGETKRMKSSKTSRADGVLSPEELQKAIEEFKAKYHANDDADKAEVEEEPVKSSPAPDAVGEEKPAEVVPAPAAEEKKEEPAAEEKPAEKEEPSAEEKPTSMEDQVKAVKGRHEDDADVQLLCDIIDTLLAQKDFAKADGVDEMEELKGDSNEELEAEEEREDNFGECEEEHKDAEDVEEEKKRPFMDDLVEDDDFNFEDEDEEDKKEELEARDEFADNPEPDEYDLHPGPNPDLKQLNTDSIDQAVRERVKICLVGKKLNLDGLEELSAKDAKKRIIAAVRPNMRLDGASDSYVNAAYDLAVDDINSRFVKDTNYQKRQMFNKKPTTNMDTADGDSADAARARMQERQASRGK